MTTEPQPKRRTWIGKWIRDETFWRDTLSQILSGICLLAIAGIVAATSGLINWSIVGQIALALLILLIVLAVAVVPPIVVGVVINRWMRRRKLQPRFWAVGFFVCLTAIASTLVASAVSNPLGSLLLSR